MSAVLEWACHHGKLWRRILRIRQVVRAPISLRSGTAQCPVCRMRAGPV